LPKNPLPITATSPERVSAEAPAPTRRVGPVFIAAYAAAYFGTWMALLTPIIVALPLHIAQIDAKGEAGDLSLILGIGAIFALVANPLFGKLSDRTRSRLGMRRPWIVGGVITGIIGLLFVFVLRDRRLARDQQLPPYGVGQFLRSFLVNPLRYPDFGWNWAGRFLIFMGLATLLSYQVFYLLNHRHETPSGVGTLVF